MDSLEGDLRKTGVTKGPEPQQRAENIIVSARQFIQDQLPLRPLEPLQDTALTHRVVPLPDQVQDFFLQRKGGLLESQHQRYLDYLAATWNISSQLGSQPEVVFDQHTQDSNQKRGFDADIHSFTALLQDRILKNLRLTYLSQHWENISDIPFDQATSSDVLDAENKLEQTDSWSEFLWEHRRDFGLLFENEGRGSISFGAKKRQTLSKVLSADNLSGLVASKLVNPPERTESDSSGYLTAVADDEVADKFPLVSFGFQLVDPWKDEEQSIERRRADNFTGAIFPLEKQIFQAVLKKARNNSIVAAEKVKMVELPQDDADSIKLLQQEFPTDHQVLILPEDTLISSVAEAQTNSDRIIPPDTITRYVNSVNSSLIGSTPTYRQLISREVLKPVLERWKGTAKSHSDRITTVVAEGVHSQEDRNGEPIVIKAAPYRLQIEIPGHTKEINFWPEDKSGRESNGKLSVGFYTDITSYAQLQQIISEHPIEENILPDFVDSAVRSEIQTLTDSIKARLASQLGMGHLPSEFGGFHLATAGKFASDLPDQVRALFPNVSDPVLYAAIRMASHLHEHNKVSSQEEMLSFDVPLLGKRTYTLRADNPISILKAFNKMDSNEIKVALAEIGEDLEVPELTLATKNYAELMSQETVYGALEQMRQNGFDAVLGKRMAAEFSFQAARVYTQNSLKALAYEVGTDPMGQLRNWQRNLLEQAKKMGYEGAALQFMDSPYAMNLDREKEVIQYLADHGESIAIVGDSTSVYMQRREIFEKFFNFAGENGLSGYERYSDLPKPERDYGDYSARNLTLGKGEYAISTQAKDYFKGKAANWKEFLTSLPESADNSTNAAYQIVKTLGNTLNQELSDMAKGNVIERAMQIIRGEVAAVGRDITEDIEVKTWQDFYTAIQQIMQTSKINLTISKEGRYGFTINTRSLTG